MSEPVWVPLGAAPVPPSSELGYGERATDLSLPTGGADIVTLAPIELDGATTIVIEFGGMFTCPTGQGFGVDLYDGAVNLGKLCGGYDVGGYFSARGRRRFTPAAGSHTYKVRGYGLVGTQTLYVTTGSNVPAFMAAMRA